MMDNKKFSVPDSPPLNYKSVLNLRNKQQEMLDRNNPDLEKKMTHFSFCGVNCCECDYYTRKKDASSEIGCVGCRRDENDCDIAICCKDKEFKNCSFCDQFPCDMLRKASLDNDAENLMTLKHRLDKRNTFHEHRRNAFLSGIVIGALIGLVVGLIIEKIFLWTIIGMFVGFSIVVIINCDEKK